MRIVSFNCEDITRATRNGFFDWVLAQDADVICLQDIRANESELADPVYTPDEYFSYFFNGYNPAREKGGVAIYSRIPPKAIITGLGFPVADSLGLCIQADFDRISIASLLVPEGNTDDDSQDVKFKFMEDYLRYLHKQQRKRREFLICGTWQIAHRKIDVASWRDFQSASGFLPPEQAWMDEIIETLGYVDTYREVDRESGRFTWWENSRLRNKNMGWRLDYQMATAGMRHRVLNGGIYTSEVFSRHAPVIIDYDWTLSF